MCTAAHRRRVRKSQNFVQQNLLDGDRNNVLSNISVVSKNRDGSFQKRSYKSMCQVLVLVQNSTFCGVEGWIQNAKFLACVCITFCVRSVATVGHTSDAAELGVRHCMWVSSRDGLQLPVLLGMPTIQYKYKLSLNSETKIILAVGGVKFKEEVQCLTTYHFAACMQIALHYRCGKT